MGFVMKIISLNVRGFGSVEKKNEVRPLVVEKGTSIVCLQETKLSDCDTVLCTSLWGWYEPCFFISSFVGGFEWTVDFMG